MEKTASQIQKERIKELEGKANALIAKCDVATLTSINEKGYSASSLLPSACYGRFCWCTENLCHYETKDVHQDWPQSLRPEYQKPEH